MGQSQTVRRRPQAGLTRARDTKRRSLADRIVEHLLRADVTTLEASDAATLAKKLRVPYSTLTAHLRRLMDRAEGKEQVYPVYVVNPFRTRFRYLFRIDVRLNSYQLGSEHAQRPKEEASFTDPIVWFVGNVVQNIEARPEIAEHLIVTDAAFLHGAPERDVEFHVLTDDGLNSIGRFVREHLMAHSCVQGVNTAQVGWRRAFEGRPGKSRSFGR